VGDDESVSVKHILAFSALSCKQNFLALSCLMLRLDARMSGSEDAAQRGLPPKSARSLAKVSSRHFEQTGEPFEEMTERFEQTSRHFEQTRGHLEQTRRQMDQTSCHLEQTEGRLEELA
jgi:chromosome segregation ATPase